LRAENQRIEIERVLLDGVLTRVVQSHNDDVIETNNVAPFRLNSVCVGVRRWEWKTLLVLLTMFLEHPRMCYPMWGSNARAW